MPRLCRRRGGKEEDNEIVEDTSQSDARKAPFSEHELKFEPISSKDTAQSDNRKTPFSQPQPPELKFEPVPQGYSSKELPQVKSSAPTNVGLWEPLATLAEEFRYNKNFKQKVKMLLEDGYQGWRRVRGDGNCFYRAVGYGVVEHLLRAEPKQRKIAAGQLYEKLSKLKFKENSVEQTAHRELLARFEVLRDTGGWEPITIASEWDSLKSSTNQEALYQSIVDPQGTLDLALVYALRLLAAKFLTEHADDAELNEGLSFEMVVLAEDYASVEDFCQRIVLPMGVEAESLVLKALPGALGLNLRVVFLDREVPVGGTLPTIDYPREDEAGPDIHIQLRPGHYDLLYLSKD